MGKFKLNKNSDESLCCIKITNPTHCEKIKQLELIEGLTHPNDIVKITIDKCCPLYVMADENGVFQAVNPYKLSKGAHKVCVRNCCNCCVCVNFCVDDQEIPPRPNCSVTPIEARMGFVFRTIDIDVKISGTPGNATVYYLLLPPGSPAPTVDQIMNYSDSAKLITGESATGQFETEILSSPITYAWTLTGLDKANLPNGTTGIIDGYRYDVYICIACKTGNSGVLTFNGAVMGMPFAAGRGTSDNPFAIRQLSDEELQRYPDLLADNPLNWPGVDEDARMLENIERLITLYERTGGYYGLADSMELSYLMISNIDLTNYKTAYNGAGWESIGDIDGWVNEAKENEHLFSGSFDGDNLAISNLSITPQATDSYFVRYRGLFGGVEEGVIVNLKLINVTIDAYTTAPGYAQLGSFISIARNPVLKNLTLENADIKADTDFVQVGDNHSIDVGGFVGEIYDGCDVSFITGKNININVASDHARAIGGFIGFSDKFSADESYHDIDLTMLTLSGYSMIGGFAGYFVYGVNLIQNVNINNTIIIAPGGQSGGLIGLHFTHNSTGNVSLHNNSVKNLVVTSNSSGESGSDLGGLIGASIVYPFNENINSGDEIFGTRNTAEQGETASIPTNVISRCSVIGGIVTGYNNGGGLIGRIEVFNTNVLLCKTDIAVTMSNTNGGGLIGYCDFLSIDQSYSLNNVSVIITNGGGLCGLSKNSIISNCYSLSNVTSGTICGGCIGSLTDSSQILTSYYVGTATSVSISGGITGLLSSSTVKNDLVLGGSIISGNAHRIIGIAVNTNTISGNYALDTVIPAAALPDPNGIDGGTITDSQIIMTMNSLGWDTPSIWNTSSVAVLGRPTLTANPE